MKNLKHQNLLALLTFLALIAILVVQVDWLFKAARFKEIHFNHMVTKALIEAREDIGQSASTCSDMNNYLCGRPCKINVREQKIAELDSIIRSKMEIYHIDLDYTFEITETDPETANDKLFGARFYLQSLNGMLEKDGIKIALNFPERNQFLLSQISGASLLAFVSVLFVMFSFLFTSRMFRKERKMLQQTSDFINNMVHEFQTPLANIRFASSLIRKKEKSIGDSKIMEYVSVISKENDKMEKHVEEILRLSCQPNERGVAQPVNINLLAEQTAKAFQSRIESLQGQLTINLQAKKATLAGTPEHFRLMLSNLLDNAIKYSQNSPMVKITTRNENKQLIIEVSDQGIGIEKSEYDRIFEKYYRISTGDVHNVKGFGLGLTYVKQMCELYGGSIKVEEGKQKGSVFTINLPLDDETN
ncbi:sensor histidine kinase [Roseimarinus sediminis]|uniref:sensor histidine kinase n=1 Tax=Roseimarinus sediminis TaxID=1610899 RepID=UPI003D19B91B